MPSVRQTNFAAGELDPKLWGRTDLPEYGRGLRRCRNFLVSHQGAAVSRPGTRLVRETKGAGYSGKVRLVPFVFTPAQSYVLEFGHQYIRFHSNGGTVFWPDESGPYELYGLPWVEDDLPDLQWAQVGDVLTVTHPNHPPYEIRRLSHASWTATEVGFGALEPYFREVDDPTAATPPPSIAGPLPVADAEHPAREWAWVVTVLAQDIPTGRVFESLAWVVNDQVTNPADPDHSHLALPSPLLVPLSADRPVTLARYDTAGLISQPAGWDAFRVLAYNVYRGRGGLFGFVGQTKSRTFVDVGEEPDYKLQPPLGTNPFLVAGDGGHVDHPRAVAFWQERRVFGGTATRPATLWLSATGEYTNYDIRTTGLTADMALEYELLAYRREEIRSLLPLGALLIFSSGSVWALDSQEALGPDVAPRARVVDGLGASALPPLLLGQRILYAQALGTGVRMLQPSNTASAFDSSDVTMQARHLFEPPAVGAPGLKDWAYAHVPYGQVWVTLKHGDLLSLTLGTQSLAWARHDSGPSEAPARFENVCAVPEGTEDAVYLVVSRTVNGVGKRFVERLESRVTTAQVAAVDCAVTYDGAPTVVIAGLGHLEGEEVWAVCMPALVYPMTEAPPKVLQGPYVVTGGQVELDEATPSPGTTVVGLGFTAELETLDVASGEARLKPKSVVRVGFEVDASRGLYVGQDEGHLTEWRQRSVADGYGGVSAASALVDVNVAGTYDKSARAFLRQTLPLPVTVLGITRELDVGT